MEMPHGLQLLAIVTNPITLLVFGLYCISKGIQRSKKKAT